MTPGSQLESLQRVLQDYATPIVTLQRPLNRDAIYLTIAWGECAFTRDKELHANRMGPGLTH